MEHGLLFIKQGLVKVKETPFALKGQTAASMSQWKGSPPPYKHLLYEAHDNGRVILLSFNRPAKFNCVNVQLHRELIDAWERFNSDDKARVAVLTGEGSEAFCSGADLTEGQDLAPTDEADLERHNR